MIEDIKMVKAKVLNFMAQEVDKYGTNRMDVKQVGELADAIKDLAEAEYYCSVAEAMSGGNEASGYGGGRMGYSGQGDSNGGMGGGNRMGHTDPMSTIRDIIMTSDPDTRMRIRNEVMGM